MYCVICDRDFDDALRDCPHCDEGSCSSVCSEAVTAARKVPEDGLKDCLFWTESYLAEIKRRMNQNAEVCHPPEGERGSI
jgi:hypothetical protein